jgi:hypothetical protein
MFADNSYCKELMLMVEAAAFESEQTHLNVAASEKRHENGVELEEAVEIFYADMGVYTKNRNWRMPWCTKSEQDRPIVPQIPNAEGVIKKLHHQHMSKKPFFDNLVTYLPKELQDGSRPLLLLKSKPSGLVMKRYTTDFRRQLQELRNTQPSTAALQHFGIAVSYFTTRKVGENGGSSDTAINSTGPSSVYRRVGVTRVRKDAPPPRLRQLLSSLEPYDKLYGIIENLLTGVVSASSLNRECAAHGRTHSSNHTIIKIYSKTGTWQRSCHHGGAVTQSLPLPPELQEEAFLYYKQDRGKTTTDLSSLFSIPAIFNDDQLKALWERTLQAQQHEVQQEKEKEEEEQQEEQSSSSSSPLKRQKKCMVSV